MNNERSVIESMKKLGLSEYESKTYLSLLNEYPVNGYVLSKNSQVPRSRIYEVLENLKAKQIIFEQKDGKNTLYYPLEPKLLINKIKQDFNQRLGIIDQFTQELYYQKKESNEVTVIRGREAILDFTSLLISQAEKRIALSIWEQESAYLKDSLEKALAKGVMLTGIFFGKHNPFTQLAAHRRIERVMAEKKERNIVLIVDYHQVVYGVVSRGKESQATWTQDRGFVQMSEDYIVHDISINKLLAQFEGAARAKHEAFLDQLRKSYFGF